MPIFKTLTTFFSTACSRYYFSLQEEFEHSLSSRTQFMTAKRFLFEIRPKWAYSGNVAASKNVTQFILLYWFSLQTHLRSRRWPAFQGSPKNNHLCPLCPGRAEQRPFVVFAGKARRNFIQGPPSSPLYIIVSVVYANKVTQKYWAWQWVDSNGRGLASTPLEHRGRNKDRKGWVSE